MQMVDMSLPPALAEMERGAVIMPAVAVEGERERFQIAGGGFDPDVVRGALLLFDQLVHADNNAISVGDLDEECASLPNVHASRVRYNGMIQADVFSRTLAEVFGALEKRESGRWSFARNTNLSGLPRELLGDATAFKIRLENALPLPDRSLPYEDVLAFKARRKDELFALRLYLDGLALEASRNGLGGLAETHAYESFLKSLQDYNRAVGEQNFLKRLMDVEIKFNWSGLLKGGAIGAVWTQSLSASALSALAGAISIESALGLKTKADTPSPFEYVFRAKNEM